MFETRGKPGAGGRSYRTMTVCHQTCAHIRRVLDTFILPQKKTEKVDHFWVVFLTWQMFTTDRVIVQ